MSDIVQVIAEHVQHFTGRGWVFQTIDAWLADPGAERMFLLTGGPGSGKTAIATRLVQISQGDTPPAVVSHLGTNFLSAAQRCATTALSRVVWRLSVAGLPIAGLPSDRVRHD